MQRISFKQHFLIAMPGLKDPNFTKSVTCICEHNHAGALGVNINKAHPMMSLKEIFSELNIKYISEISSLPIYIGGPVQINELFILHGPPFNWETSLKITPSLALTNTRDILEAIAVGSGPESFLVALGCAGWGPGQLEAEIQANAWLTSPLSNEIIFEIPIETRWDESLKSMGIDPAMLSNTIGHA